MTKFNLRQKPRISYCDYEEPNLDEYVFCEKCGDFVYEYCSIHGPLLVIPDDKVPIKTNYPSFVPRAALTIPKMFLHIAPSIIPGAGLGVFTTLTLPRGVRFGPYRGERTTKIESMYCWQLHDGNNKWSHVVDAADANMSNWMRYVNCARHWCEQNLVAYQYQGQIYYRTIKIIPRFTELLVFYGGEYARLLDVNLKHYNSPSGYAQKFGATVHKKRKLSADIGNGENHKSQTTSIQADEGKLNSTQSQDIEKKSHLRTEKTNKISTKLIKSTEYNNTKSYVNTGYDESKQEKGLLLKNNSQKIISTFTCDVCKQNFVCKNILECHMKSHYTVLCKEKVTIKSNDEIKNNKTEVKKPHQCDICKKSFASKSYLNIHVRIHTGKKPYQCDICNKSFVQDCSLARHVRIHTGEKPYQCNICDKAFIQKSTLIDHVRIHTGEKPYQCNICDKAFIQKSTLIDHVRIHTGEKPYQCNICDKAFKQKSTLIDHVRIHTGEKPYQCNICDKAFIQKSTLIDHVRIHTGEKPYQCNICDKAFIQKSTLIDHVRIHTGEKPYQCNICDKSFTRKNALNYHIKTHHN